MNPWLAGWVAWQVYKDYENTQARKAQPGYDAQKEAEASGAAQFALIVLFLIGAGLWKLGERIF